MTLSIDVRITRETGYEDIPVPSYQSMGASGVDLHAAVRDERIIPSGCMDLVPTGLRMAIPEGYEAQIRPRSGLALKNSVGILNSPGTIDSDYRGPVGIILINLGKKPFVIRRGDRIAQMVFCPIVKAHIRLVDEIDNTDRGEGGFGHTGV